MRELKAGPAFQLQQSEPDGNRPFWRYRHSSGASVSLLDSPGYYGAFVLLQFRHGAAWRRTEGPEGLRLWPAGTAHFIEHLCFNEGSAASLSEQMAQFGAECNAETAYEQTRFYFSAGEELVPALRLFLEQCLSANWPDSRVACERAIILEEYNGYLDEPESSALQQVYSRLYQRAGLKDDILGTPESLAGLEPDVLRAYARQLYQPALADLVIVADAGRFPAVLAELDPLLSRLDRQEPVPKRLVQAEYPQLQTTSIIQLSHPNCCVPQFYWALPMPLHTAEPSPAGRVRRRLVAELCCDLLFGVSSAFYERLQRQGAIHDDFQLSYEWSPEHRLLLMSGSSADAERSLALIDEALAALQIDWSKLPQLRRGLAGELFAVLDRQEDLAALQAESVLRACDFREQALICDKIGAKDLEQELRTLVPWTGRLRFQLEKGPLVC